MDDGAVVERLTKACEIAGSQREWAKTHNLSPAYVSDVLKGKRGPGQSILDALGLVKRVEYHEPSVAKPKRRQA